MQTYTAEQIEAMTKAQQIALLEELGRRTYGNERWVAAFCRQAGLAPKTVYNWKTPDGPPVSVLALLLLQEWAGSQMPEKILLEGLQRIGQDVHAIAQTLNDTARQVAANLSDLGEPVARDDPADASQIDESRL